MGIIDEVVYIMRIIDEVVSSIEAHVKGFVLLWPVADEKMCICCLLVGW